jgi:ribosome-associated protein
MSRRRSSSVESLDLHPGDPDQPLSKTRLKQLHHDLQELGEALLDLGSARFASLELPDELRRALEELRRTRSHEGRRRQRQYVGKLMSGIDPAPLQAALAEQRLPSAQATLALHQAEAWRERLVADDHALTDWLAEHPDTDSQALRALIRQARRELAAREAAPAGEAPRMGRAWRDLFAQVREGLAAQRAAAEADAAQSPIADTPDARWT